MDKKSRRSIWNLGMAGLGRNVGWGMNKVFTPGLLAALTPSTQLIGLVLGVEGLFGLILNPLTGYVSDRHEGKGGRRRPYLLVAFPGAAIMLILLYLSKSLGLAIGAAVLFYFFQQLSPTPYQAMMPDALDEKAYGQASGILNLLWAVGNLIAFLVVPVVYTLVSHSLGFILGATILLAGGLWTAFSVKEKRRETQTQQPSLRPLLSGTLMKYYVAQGLWWLGFEAIASFFALYMVNTLHGGNLDTALGMSIFTIAGIIVSMRFGRLYHRHDSRTLLGITIAVFALVSLTGVWLTTVTEAFVLLFVAGLAWGGIQVVSYPLAADILRQELARSGLTGTAAEERAVHLHGALYGGANLVQSVALMLAAPVAGWLIAANHNHYQVMFLVSFASLVLALGLVLVLGRVEVAVPEPVQA